MSRDTTTDSSGGEHVGSPEEAFSVLGDETRLEILLALVDSGTENGLTFSELRKRVGIEDSGRFNYHLDKLSDGFITKDDDEYYPLYPSLEVVSAIYAGLYGGEHDEQTADSHLDCPECGQPLDAQYEQDQLILRCPDHDVMLGYPAPPGAYNGRSLSELTDVVFARAITEMDLNRQGICSRCWGTVDVEYPVEPDLGEEVDTEDLDFVFTQVTCTQCWLDSQMPLAAVLTSHPAVRALYDEHGIEASQALFGQRGTMNTDIVDVSVHDNGGATMTVDLEGDRLVLEVDENCRVVEQFRE